MRNARYWLGRHLVHLGLRVMPQGRARSELFRLFDEWGTRVYLAIKEAGNG